MRAPTIQGLSKGFDPAQRVPRHFPIEPRIRGSALATTGKIHIIGIGEGGLDGVTDAARRLILNAELLVGESQCLSLVPEATAERMAVGTNLAEGRPAASGDKATVILAGDPVLRVRATSATSSETGSRSCPTSTACSWHSRVKESWEEAFLTNLADHSLVPCLARFARREGRPVHERPVLPPGGPHADRQRLDSFTGCVLRKPGLARRTSRAAVERTTEQTSPAER